MGWRDAQSSGELADFPEGLGSVTPLLRDPIPTSDLLGTKHTLVPRVYMQTKDLYTHTAL